MENLMMESLKASLIKHAMWTNKYAGERDVNRNHTNYGSTIAYANVLESFGVNIDVPVFGENGFLKIPKLIIDLREIVFEE